MPDLEHAWKPPKVEVNERLVVFLVAAIQFINILEFMIVMPLGPDYAAALGIPASLIGVVGGCYTISAAVSGLIASSFIERFDRRSALTFLMIGLLASTLAAGFAIGLKSLLAARICAGLFGGPATSMSMAIITDVIAPERRGKAMGIVSSAFACAAVLGVPAGLELSRLGGWQMPFFAITALGLVVVFLVVLRLPSLRDHITQTRNPVLADYKKLLRRRDVVVSLTMAFCSFSGVFMLVPSIAPYLIANLGYPREYLGLLYLVGGVFNFGATLWVGRLVDKYSAALIGSIGMFFQCVIILAMFYFTPAFYWIMPLFVSFMFVNSFRNVPFRALITKVPNPFERAQYMSLQTSVQHFSAALGAFFASILLTEAENGYLTGVPIVAVVATIVTALVPRQLYIVEGLVQRQAKARSVRG